jgi:hypothetical protein
VRGVPFILEPALTPLWRHAKAASVKAPGPVPRLRPRSIGQTERGAGVSGRTHPGLHHGARTLITSGDAGGGDLHVAVLQLGALPLEQLRLGDHTGHQGINCGAVPNRMQAVGACDLPDDADVSLPVRPADQLPFPTLNRWIGPAAKPTARAMRPWIRFALAFPALLVAGFTLHPLSGLGLPFLTVDLSPVGPQRRQPAAGRVLCPDPIWWPSI